MKARVLDLAKFFGALPAGLRRQRLARFLLWLSPESRIQLVEFNHHARCFADISDPFPQTYFLHRSFDLEFFSVVSPFLSEGGVFFDVGANFGFCTFGLLARIENPSLECHLFEANEEMGTLLKRSASLYPDRKIFINTCCVSDRNGISRLFIKRNHLGASYISAKGTQTVSNMVLDEYISKNGIRTIDLMKMDIEGSEPLALRGALKSLKSGMIKAIYMEVSAATLSQLNFRKEDCFDLLRDAGFRLYFAKDIDFRKGVARGAMELRVKGQSLRVAPLKDFPEGHETDILAVHERSGFGEASL